MGRFLALEYGGDDLDRLLTLAEGDRPAIGVLSQTTAGDLGRSARWRELYHPHGIGDELRLALFADDYCWGYLECSATTPVTISPPRKPGSYFG